MRLLRVILPVLCFLLLAVSPSLGQIHQFPALDTNNTFTGTNTFNGVTNFPGGISGAFAPAVAGGSSLGTSLFPYSSVFVGGVATNNIQITGTATGARVFTLPDANSNPVQPSTAPSNQFATAVSASGVISYGAAVVASTAPANQFATAISAAGGLSYAQPSFGNISGSISIGQTPLTTRGDLLVVGAGPALTRLPIGGANLYPKSNGTDIVFSSLAAGGVGTCTNQVITGLNADAPPTCASVSPAMTSASTGSGAFVLATSPVLTTPNIGAASATSVTTAVGSAGSPPFAFATDLTTGIYDLSSGNLAVSTSGVGRAQFNSSGEFIPSGACFDWNSGALGSTQDTGMCRDSAGVIDFGNGSPGDKSGTINAANMNITSSLATGGLSSTKAYRDARQDGVVCDGVTEDGAHINTAIANAITNQQSIVILPATASGSGCKVSTSLNMTNRSAIKLRGGGMGNHVEPHNNRTTILCNTGTSPCIDRTGSSEQSVEEITLSIQNAFSTPSTVAMLLGRDNALGGGTGVFCFAQFNHDRHIQIEADNNAVVNGGRGYIGIYNVGAELYTIEDSDIIANVPAWFDTANTLSIASAYQTLQTGCPASMTGVTSQNTGWSGVGNNVTHIINLQGSPTGDFYFNQTFFGWGANGIAGGCNASGQFAIDTGTGTIFGLVVTETDDYEINCAPGGFLFTNGNLKSSYIHPQTAIPTGTSAWFVPGNGTTWTDVDFGITKSNAGDTSQNLLGSVNTVTITGGRIMANDAISPINVTNTTLTGTIVQAPGFTDANVTFNSASKYTLMDNSGTSIIGGVNQTMPYKRLKATNGTAVATGDFVLSAGWGTTASKGFAVGSDGWGALGITSSGTGQAANPTVTFTFHDGAWANSPLCIPQRVDANTAPTNVLFGEQSATTTQIVWVFQGTPVAGNSYSLHWGCQDR